MSLRIWLWGDSINYVINLQKNQSAKSGDLLAFHTPDSAGNFIIRCKIVNLKPMSGWDILLPQLDSFTEVIKINRKIGGLTVLKGMRYVYVELKEKGSYTFVKYLQPSYYWKADKDLQTVHSFLAMLAKEFKIPAYPPAEKAFEQIY